MTALAPLGSTYCEDCVPRERESALILRFMLQDEAARLLPDGRVSKCLRWLAPVHANMGEQSKKHDHVDLTYDSARNVARYRNLIVCESVWACPVCASTISTIRRKRIAEALDRSGLYCALATFTLSHHKKQSLDYVLSSLLAAYRALKSGHWWQGFVKRYGWEGDIRALEITYGANGWHPHIHAIMTFQTLFDVATLAECENLLKVRFEGILARSGAYASSAHSVKMTDDSQEVRNYISKFGKLPREVKHGKWTIEHELVSGHTKTARSQDGATPWAMLASSLAGDTISSGLFITYATSCKGRNQLVWSRGLQEKLQILQSDTANESEAERRQIIGQIDKYEWYRICALRLRGELLERVKATRGDVQLINDWLSEELAKGE